MPIAAGRRPRDRRRLLGGDARRLPRARPSRPGVADLARPARSATCATRRSTSRVPLVICPFRSLLHLQTDEERLRRALRAVRDCSGPGGRLRLRRLRARAGRHRGDARPLARARARDLRTRRLGRRRPHAHAVGARRRSGRRRWRSPGSRPPSGARCSSSAASRSRPATAGSTAARTGRRGHVWIARRALTRVG